MSKDEFEAWMKLAEFERKKFDTRREYEWKVSLGLWAAILGSFAVLKGIEISCWGAVVCLAVPIGHYCLWLQPLQRRNDQDDVRANGFRDNASKAIKPDVTLEPQIARPWYKRWSANFQAAATLALMWSVFLALKAV